MKSPCKSSKITPHDYNSRFVDDINKQNKTKQKKAVTQNTSTTCKYQQKATREVKIGIWHISFLIHGGICMIFPLKGNTHRRMKEYGCHLRDQQNNR